MLSDHTNTKNQTPHSKGTSPTLTMKAQLKQHKPQILITPAINNTQAPTDSTKEAVTWSLPLKSMYFVLQRT
jgi:hypothetical protein